VVDAAMLDGAVSFMAMFMGFRSMGMYRDETGSNVLAGAAHFYDTYETADGKFVAIAALEPAFYALLIERAGLDPAVFEGHGFRLGQPADETDWPRLKNVLADVMRQRTRDDWCELLEGTDACFAPVLGLSEAPSHPHNLARGTFTEVAGQVQNAPAPRFDRTPPGAPRPARPQGADGREVLAEAGYSEAEIEALADSGAVELGRGEA
jgi:alpha-methylacyl-CoA racemase